MFKVKIEGFNKVKAQFAAATSNLTKIVDSELEAASKEWVGLAKRDAPADQGTLRGSISSYPDGSLKYEIVAQVFYAPYMEFGTKGKYRPIPGTEAIAAQFKGQKHGDFAEMLRFIKLWCKRKGIEETLAFPIAMSILKKGINPHPFFFKQQAIVWPKMLQRITRRIENSKLDAIKNRLEPV